MAMIWTVLGMALLPYLMIVLLVFALQERLVYFPNIPGRDITATPASVGLAYESVSIRTEDGERLDAWFVPASSARGTLVHFHGNAGNIGHRLELLLVFHRLRLNVLLFDYRGYGQSTGSPGEQGTYRDAESVWRYLTTERGIAARQLVLHGQSLGGAIAAQLATRVMPAALILESTFISVPVMAADIYPWLPGRWLARLHYDTGAYLSTVACPVLIIHSRTDEIVPFSHGEQLYRTAREPKELLVIRGDHNAGFSLSADVYPRGIGAFLDGLQP